jgi:hypothetical protein
MTRRAAAVLAVAIFLAVPEAFGAAWQPSAGHTQLPIWPGAVPDAQPAGPEDASVVDRSLVAGKPWIAVAPVSQPTITVYRPTTANAHTAVVVFPGGGYRVLAIDLEGTEVCDWLTSRASPACCSSTACPA